MISVGEEESLEYMAGHAKYAKCFRDQAPHAIAMALQCATVLHY